MVDLIIAAFAEDNRGGPVSLSVDVTSDEPEEGLGDGDLAPDWSIISIDDESGIVYLQLRAERSGRGEGRLYTITITCTDESGNSSAASLDVVVPHDKREK
jgi:hypothetical protein